MKHAYRNIIGATALLAVAFAFASLPQAHAVEVSDKTWRPGDFEEVN